MLGQFCELKIQEVRDRRAAMLRCEWFQKQIVFTDILVNSQKLSTAISDMKLELLLIENQLLHIERPISDIKSQILFKKKFSDL